METLVRPLHWDVALDAEVVTLGRGAEHLLGPPSALNLGSWLERIHPEDVEALTTAIGSLRDGRMRRWAGRYRLRTKGGSYLELLDRLVVVERGGRPHRIVGCARPLSSLVHPADPFTSTPPIVDLLPNLAWVADATGSIEYFNDRFYAYTGATPSEVEGWGWLRVHDPEDLPRMLAIWRAALHDGQPWEDEFKIRRGADGMYRWHLSRAFPLRDASGRVVRWFGTNTDVHDQKLALEERERLLKVEQVLRREAEAANREKDQFLAVVSHELRTPLGAVLGWAQLLRRSSLDPEKLAAGLEKIERNSRILGRLIEDLLDVSRIITGKLDIERAPVELGDIVRHAVESLAGEAARKRLDLRLTVEGPPAIVLGQAERLHQVVVNLLGNAIKFSHDGQPIELRLEATGQEVELRIQDWGLGFDPSFIPELFRRFSQADSSTRRRHAGLGLGLSIVRHLVELHGGTVTGHSDGPATGATFTVRLPRADQPTAIPPRPAHRRVDLDGVRVLAVDDDPETRELLAATLLGAGASVTLAGSVAEAMRALRLDLPDAVVTDLAMPDIDGYQLISWIRDSSLPNMAEVPVIALTAHASVQDRARAREAGFDAYLEKPFETTALCRTVAEVLRDRRTGG